jgi:hypothetical protein
VVVALGVPVGLGSVGVVGVVHGVPNDTRARSGHGVRTLGLYPWAAAKIPGGATGPDPLASLRPRCQGTRPLGPRRGDMGGGVVGVRLTLG